LRKGKILLITAWKKMDQAIRKELKKCKMNLRKNHLFSVSIRIVVSILSCKVGRGGDKAEIKR
jgi:hypothetical protein